jgi:hypothetical protein
MSFSIRKPSHWPDLPLFSKLKYYKTQLDERYAPYVDKLEAKKIVNQTVGGDISIPKVIRILNSPDDFKQSDINPNHMVKAAHGSGWNITMIKDTKIKDVLDSLQKWNTHYDGAGEKQYSYIHPRFFIEEKVDGPRGGNAIVYMVRCIHGQPVTIGVKLNKQNMQNSYDTDWNPIVPIKIPNIEKPKSLDTILKLAAKLSEPFEFVRIDFYYVNNTIYFSEYTFTPAGGTKIFPHDLEMKYGALWT